MNNERLTMHTPDGACLILKAYNEMDARRELMKKFKKACNKLTELEDKFENGTLIELPCKVGNTVYVLEYEDDCAIDYSGYVFIMANNDFAFLSPIINEERNPIELCNEFFDRYINAEDNSGIIVPLSELYLTKEKAEKKLEELKK